MKIFISLAIILSVIIFTGIWFAQEIAHKNPQAITYTIKPGDSLKQIATGLKHQHVIGSAYAFMALAYIEGHTQALKAGEYLFEKNSTAETVLDKIVRGDVMMHSLRIGEGWTFAQITQAILAQDALQKTLDWQNPDTILQQLNLSEHKPEGLFYPETYHFPRNYTDASLLTLAYKEMQTFLDKAWQARDPYLPYENPYQALIAASIIEKETAVASELTQVAGVVVRRLQKGMLLQVDPTVVFGLGAHYDRPLTKDDLKLDTPYNTYLHLGLPPTPIAIPSPLAIEAALHPSAGDALYFVARGDGTHVFTDNLDAHNKAVQEYRKLLETQ
ncbi:MAG: endolytic transglycosylase MltG [Gammaproteobacteria bacterium]|jgi:UPF0755 protein